MVYILSLKNGEKLVINCEDSAPITKVKITHITKNGAETSKNITIRKDG